jgi:hypothetical protein
MAIGYLLELLATNALKADIEKIRVPALKFPNGFQGWAELPPDAWLPLSSADDCCASRQFQSGNFTKINGKRKAQSVSRYHERL